MSDIQWNRMTLPITTGKAQWTEQRPAQGTQAQEPAQSFSDMLKAQLGSSQVAFSKHAVQRVEQRNIPLTDASLDRLNQGVQLAKEKGLNDALVIVDQTAFIVNAQLGKVITTVGQDDLNGNVFTNIEGTVII